MGGHILWVLVEKGPVFDICRDWVGGYFKARAAALEWAKSHGFDNVFLGLNGEPVGVVSHERREGWTVPNYRGKSRPRVRTPANDEMNAMKGVPHFSSVLEEAFGPMPRSLSYKGEGFKGAAVVGGFFGPGCYTFNGIDGPFLIDLPDMTGAQKAKQDKSPTATFCPDYSDWANPLPETRVILREEWDLMAAQHEHARKIEEQSS